MEEVKVRIQYTETALLGKLFIPSQIVRESAYLQLRLICELIALGCLVMHGDLKSVREKRFMKAYDAAKIIEGLEALHSHFYPMPITTEDVTPKHKHLTPIETGFLTKADLIALYGKSGDFLHRGNLKKLLKAKMPIEHHYPDIWDWLQKIGKLLSNHQMGLLDGRTHFLCVLSAARLGGACQVAIAEAAEPPPDVQKTFDDHRKKS
jgi:hypothetical protein